MIDPRISPEARDAPLAVRSIVGGDDGAQLRQPSKVRVDGSRISIDVNPPRAVQALAFLVAAAAYAALGWWVTRSQWLLDQPLWLRGLLAVAGIAVAGVSVGAMSKSPATVLRTAAISGGELRLDARRDGNPASFDYHLDRLSVIRFGDSGDDAGIDVHAELYFRSADGAPKTVCLRGSGALYVTRAIDWARSGVRIEPAAFDELCAPGAGLFAEETGPFRRVPSLLPYLGGIIGVALFVACGFSLLAG